jgi:peptidoglycan/xylan/chitin deacetylase (PgdA/CDA1 family)
MNHLKASLGAIALLAFVVAGQAAADQHGEAPIWSLSPDEIAEIVNRVRGGDDLTPSSWPDGAKVAVGLSFDVDTEPVWMGVFGLTSPSYMSRGEYGVRAAMPRIMELLSKHDVSASFFIPALTMELHPVVVEVLRAAPRHEIGFHSYVHENPLSLNEEQERSVYARAMDLHIKNFGRKPVGFRSAAWDLTDATIKIVKEMGFLYESSMMADDRPYELISEGQETGLIELPVEWILDDWPFFQLTWPAGHVSIRNADDVYSIWADEFDGAYEEGTVYILTMHPQVIGHRYRLKMLDRLISYMKSKPGVWFATHEEIARHVKMEAGM